VKGVPIELNVAGRGWHEDERKTLPNIGVGDVVAVAGLDVLDGRWVHGGFDYSEGAGLAGGYRRTERRDCRASHWWRSIGRNGQGAGNLGGLARSTELLRIRAELVNAVGFRVLVDPTRKEGRDLSPTLLLETPCSLGKRLFVTLER
jgi:hypothetical protein